MPQSVIFVNIPVEEMADAWEAGKWYEADAMCRADDGEGVNKQWKANVGHTANGTNQRGSKKTLIFRSFFERFRSVFRSLFF